MQVMEEFKEMKKAMEKANKAAADLKKLNEK